MNGLTDLVDAVDGGGYRFLGVFGGADRFLRGAVGHRRQLGDQLHRMNGGVQTFQGFVDLFLLLGGLQQYRFGLGFNLYRGGVDLVGNLADLTQYVFDGVGQLVDGVGHRTGNVFRDRYTHGQVTLTDLEYALDQLDD